jgi:hypothetical protein
MIARLQKFCQKKDLPKHVNCCVQGFGEKIEKKTELHEDKE